MRARSMGDSKRVVSWPFSTTTICSSEKPRVLQISFTEFEFAITRSKRRANQRNSQRWRRRVLGVPIQNTIGFRKPKIERASAA